MHPTVNSGTLQSDANDTVIQIPDDLQQYLETTGKPQEIYHLVEREHDRRVRLLLRRFTNQIQYGCTNPRCNVPTCLSYRSRASPGPLRPHTDLTARALAVKCLEQYTTYGRDLGRYPNREKGKRKQAIPESDGLCWNEPVIPWYTDPNEHIAKRNVATRRRRSSQGKGPSDHTFRKDFPTTTTTTSTFTTSPARKRQESADHLRTDTAAELRPVSIERPFLDRFSGERKNISISRSQSGSETRSEDHTYANGHVIDPGVIEVKRVGQRHDQASLAQSLFKHPTFQLLDTPPEIHSAVHKGATKDREENLKSTVSQPSGDSKLSHSAMGLIHSNQSVTTFRILPPKAIQWFREAFTKYQETDDIPPDHLNSFLNQSLFFVLSDPIRLLQSASTWSDLEPQVANRDPSVKTPDVPLILPPCEHVVWFCAMIAHCFECSGKSFHFSTYLLQALGHCYQLPQHIKQSNTMISATRKQHSFVPNWDVAHLVLLALSMIPPTEMFLYRIENQINHDIFENRENSPYTMHEKMACSQNRVHACRLCECIADLISHRIAIDSATEASKSKTADAHRSRGIIAEIAALMQRYPDSPEGSQPDNHRASQMLRSMQLIVFAKWDRMPVIRRTGPVGGALEMLKGLFLKRRDLALDETEFYMDSIPAVLNEVEMPYEWITFKPDATKMHILQFSFLFPPKVVVRYFRSLNLKVMKQSHEKAMAVYANGKAQLLHGPWSVTNIDEVFDQTRAHMARYFVMTIRRSHVLEDAIGQIWQRERQELMRPLKVILGKDEGENGLDHGGVQQEFFRLVFAEAFDPQYGMFDIDSTTHMAWFKPGSLEQLYKYEALGILMSLAIYNGVTIPITMPLAFYRKILGLKVKTIDHVEDGWPEIARSFRQLLEWDDGDVEDIMALNYEFSYDDFGKTVTIDMTKTQSGKQKLAKMKSSLKGKEKASPAVQTELMEENANQKFTTFESTHYDSDSDSDHDTSTSQPTTPTPVTNANRTAFVRSYINHLTTTTINPKFTSFLNGLHTLLSPTALSLFTPPHLKLLFEGHPTHHPLSLPHWRTATKYESFDPMDPVIIWFWDILEHEMTQLQLRKLLEFVTASNRLPVNGWEGITFIVQRNGVGDERLPGSSTCYGRLLLPEYSKKQVLRERLVKAVEEGLGFGMI